MYYDAAMTEFNENEGTSVSNWGLLVSNTGHLHIVGLVFNHRRLNDGPVHTTRILAFEKEKGKVFALTRNTRYELLEPDPEFDKIYPNLKEHVSAGPVPGYFDFLLSGSPNGNWCIGNA